MALKGNLQDMKLSDIVQVACKGRKQACLRITSRDRQASLFFEKGQVVHAILDSKEGEEVVYELLTWEDGVFEVEQEVAPPKLTITTNWQGLLLEGMRRVDEQDTRLIEAKGITVKDTTLALGDSDGYYKQGIDKNKKEVWEMDVKKLNEAIEVLKGDLGGALLATDIWATADGQSLAGFNPQPKAAALFNQVTDNMLNALKGAGFPTLGRYYIMDLVDGKMAVLLPLDEYQWGMLLDSTKAPLGLLLNVVIPQIIDKFEDAIAS
jgi:hypothetical protein